MLNAKYTDINTNMSVIEWTVGLNDYKKCKLETGGNVGKFTMELLDNEFEPDRDISDIFSDHLSNRQTSKVEVLYSGGLDSELVLMSCIRKKIPVIAFTLVVKIDGMIANTHDLYYAEKFCRENNIEQKLFILDANEFYNSGNYLEYLTPYHITEPHIATHLWLLEKCNYFPIIGGDWPWPHAHKEDKILSPFKLEFSSYERFLSDRGMYGIGNMISHSLESSCKMINLHLECYNGNEPISSFKYRMYSKLEPNIEPRLKSHGWEIAQTKNFHLIPKRLELVKKVGIVKSNIIWGDIISRLINSSTNNNSLFT